MDIRERNHKWYEEFDQNAMTITFEVDGEDADGYFVDIVAVPAKFEVCHVCEGKGSHVNPSIDAHGISSEEFTGDPDFREDYFSGRYDVSCACCLGARVVPDVDESRCSATALAQVEKRKNDLAEAARERAYEQRMGF